MITVKEVSESAPLKNGVEQMSSFSDEARGQIEDPWVVGMEFIIPSPDQWVVLQEYIGEYTFQYMYVQAFKGGKEIAPRRVYASLFDRRQRKYTKATDGTFTEGDFVSHKGEPVVDFRAGFSAQKGFENLAGKRIRITNVEQIWTQKFNSDRNAAPEYKQANVYTFAYVDAAPAAEPGKKGGK